MKHDLQELKQNRHQENTTITNGKLFSQEYGVHEKKSNEGSNMALLKTDEARDERHQRNSFCI